MAARFCLFTMQNVHRLREVSGQRTSFESLHFSFKRLRPQSLRQLSEVFVLTNEVCCARGMNSTCFFSFCSGKKLWICGRCRGHPPHPPTIQTNECPRCEVALIYLHASSHIFDILFLPHKRDSATTEAFFFVFFRPRNHRNPVRNGKKKKNIYSPVKT